MYKIEVSDVRFIASSIREQKTGLLGYVSFLINGVIRIDGVTLRAKAKDSALALSFPAKRDRQGRDHSLVRPIDHATRLSIEEQVFNQIRLTLGDSK